MDKRKLLMMFGAAILICVGIGYLLYQDGLIALPGEKGELTLKDETIVIDRFAKRLMRKAKSDQFVLAVRKKFNLIANDNTKPLPNFFSPRNAKPLKFETDYFRSPFIVYYASEGGLVGGKVVTVLPVKRPDKMFDVFVYPASNGRGGTAFEFRDIRESKTAVDAALLRLFKNIIKEKDFWL